MGFLFRNNLKEWFIKNIHVRSFVNLADLQNKWIVGDIKCVVNVSSDFNEDVCMQLRQMNIAYHWFPMSEQNKDMGLHSIYGALKVLQRYVDRKEPVIIHCFGGNNRSKVVYEALYFLNFGTWPSDIDDCRTLRNCKEEHLPTEQYYKSFLQNIKAGKPLDLCLYIQK